jgi:hypothetical protein
MLPLLPPSERMTNAPTKSDGMINHKYSSQIHDQKTRESSETVASAFERQQRLRDGGPL